MTTVLVHSSDGGMRFFRLLQVHKSLLTMNELDQPTTGTVVYCINFPKIIFSWSRSSMTRPAVVNVHVKSTHIKTCWIKGGNLAGLQQACNCQPDSLLELFFIYSNCLWFVKYKIEDFLSPKFIKCCKVVVWIIWSNFPFGNKFKFQTEFELKF
jgi:hypothetical protein